MVLDRREPMSKLKYIKTILVLLFKAYLVYLWINFVETFTQLLYDIYVLKVYSVEHLACFYSFYLVIYAVFCGLFYGVSDYLQLLINQAYIIGLKTGYAQKKKKHLSIKSCLSV